MTSFHSKRWWPAALTLTERVAATRTRDAAPGSLTPPDRSASGVTASRLQRWRTQRPFDRPEFLVRRLELDRLTEPTFELLIASSPDTIASDREPPQWVAQVERADLLARELANLPRSNPVADPSGLGPVRAFVEPFVTAAMASLFASARRIAATVPNAPFDPQAAVRLFEPSLWSQLVNRALKVIILELNVARVQGNLSGDTPHERCANFAEQLRLGPVREQIIQEYPVLARSLVTAGDYWVEMAGEFLRHLVADAPLLRETFTDTDHLGALTVLTAGAGDLHRHGRSVIVAEFSSGTRIVYKPRPLTVDKHFQELVEWINARGQDPPLRAVRTISVRDHGWAEFVANTPCATQDEVTRFYDRFGAYLAILHALNATDFHYENVIASGEWPMLVDLEALFHPLPEMSTSSDPEWLGWDTLQKSVLRTGVLPFRAYDSDRSSGIDMSAMGGAGGQQTPNRFPVLVAAGTDEMRLERDFVRLPDSQNRPTLGASAIDPAAFGGRVLAGFTRTYRLLLAHRAELLRTDGPVRRFADDEIRIVLRPTRQYALILSESHHPDVLRDALERDRLIDRLWVAVPARPELERIIQWEHAELLDGDVPFFASQPASHDLFTTHDVTVAGFFKRTGLNSAIERIESMSEDDLKRQQWIIEASLIGLLPGRHANVSPTSPLLTPTAGRERTPAPSRDEILDAASRVAERLVTVALTRDDCVSWLGLTLVRERDWVIQPVGTDLYSGSLGLALFLSYFDHVVGHSASRTIARAVVDQVETRIAETLDQLASGLPLPPGSLGAFGAFGGALYALSHIGVLWNDHRLLEVAERLVSALREHVEADKNLDIISGTAGFMMAAAAFERSCPRPSTRAGLRFAADTLVSRATRSHEGLAWATAMLAKRPLTGISHGASGIALALVTAGELLDDTALVDRGLDALTYERSTFDAARQNWPDYRVLDDRTRTEEPTTMWAWCHGAPGIGLVRLAATSASSTPDVLADLAIALDSTARFGFGGNDSLCHGDLGNLDLLIRAQELGHHGPWEHALVSESARLVSRLRRCAWRCGIPGGVETPGLMTGLAGIGYGLLRLGATKDTPSLLSLEAPRIALARRSAS